MAKQSLTKKDEIILLDFWATWCGPCRMLSPIIDKIAAEAPDNVKVLKVDIDANPELARKFQVMSVPTLIVLKDGKVAAYKSGLMQKHAILKMLSV